MCPPTLHVSFNAIHLSSNAVHHTGNVSEPQVTLQDFRDSASHVVSGGSLQRVVPFYYALYDFIYTTRCVFLVALFLCVVYYGYCLGSGTEPDEFYFGHWCSHLFFQPTMTFRILSMRLRSQNKTRKTMCSIRLDI
jgi:hypothetical protein